MVADLRARNDGPSGLAPGNPSKHLPAIWNLMDPLAADIGDRVRKAQSAFDTAVGARMAVADGRLLVDPQLLNRSMSGVSARLAHAIRQCDRDAYRRFRVAMHRLAPLIWCGERVNPIAADVIAESFLSGVADVLSTKAQRAVLSEVVLDEVAPVLAAIVQRANRLIDGKEEPPADFDPGLLIRSGIPVHPPMIEREVQGPRPDVDGWRPMPGAVVEPVELATISADTSPHSLTATASTRSIERAGTFHTRALEAIDQAQDRVQEPVETAAASVDVESHQDVVHPYLGDIPIAADSARRLGISPHAQTCTDLRIDVSAALKSVAGIAADAVAFAHATGSVPYSREARRRYFAEVKARLVRHHATPPQLSSVDLLAAMFDVSIDDAKIPDAVKPLVWRLQHPLLLLVLLDPSYLGDSSSAIRRLVEDVGVVARGYGEELTRGSELFRRLETVVRAAEIVSGALQSRSRILTMQVEREYERCSHSIAQLVDRMARERQAFEALPARRNRRDYSRRPGRDVEQQITEELAVAVARQIGGTELPNSVLAFINTVWLRVMRTTLLRDGRDSNAFESATRAVDELLWSIDSSDPASDRTERGGRHELARRIPALLATLGNGMRDIGVGEQDHQDFFDEIFLIHLRKLQGPRESDVPVLEESVPDDPSRDTVDAEEFSPSTVAKSSRRGQRLGDPSSDVPRRSTSSKVPDRLLTILKAVDLNDFPREPIVVAGDGESIDRIRVGDWLQYQLKSGEAERLKVAWINGRRSIVVLMRVSDRRAVARPLPALRAMFATGRIRLIRNGPAAS